MFLNRSLIDETERDGGTAGNNSAQESQNEQSEDNLSQVGSIQSCDSSELEEDYEHESRNKR